MTEDELLSPVQLFSSQTIYDGPATIELESFSAFPICFDALDFQTRLGGEEGEFGVGIELT